MNEIIINSSKEIYLERSKHFIQCFLDIKGGRSKYTAISYEKDIKDFFNTDDVTSITIEDIRGVNVFHVQKFILDLQNRELSSATINRKISCLSALYKWLMKYEDNYSDIRIIKFNPFANVREEKPIVTNKVTEFLTEEESRILLSSIDTSTVLGSEIINIKILNIINYGDYDVIEVTRKGSKKDLVKLQPKVKKLIEEYISATNRNKEEHKNNYLFIGHSSNNRNGEKLNPSTLNYMLKNVCNQCNIDKKLKVHSTRHTAITMAITQGATIEKVREFAAHRSIATTNRYIHSIDKLKDNPGDNIDII